MYARASIDLAICARNGPKIITRIASTNLWYTRSAIVKNPILTGLPPRDSNSTERERELKQQKRGKEEKKEEEKKERYLIEKESLLCFQYYTVRSKSSAEMRGLKGRRIVIIIFTIYKSIMQSLSMGKFANLIDHLNTCSNYIMSSSNGVSDERSQSGGDAVNKHVEHPKLKTLKMYRKAITWKLESQRHLFLHAFGEIIRDWKEPLPNLRDFLTKEEMDWLLVASIKPESSNREIVDFVARSGYKDEPDLDEDGKPVLRCTTAVHKIAERHQGASGIDLLRKLFRIYDKFRLNYTDESGYTHFYMACKYNLDDVAEKFLELGQIDPNFLVPETGDSLLYFLTVKNSLYPTRAIIRMLLKHGADPNRTSEDGSTPLQGICQMRDRHYVATKRLLESCDELQRTVTIDAQDKWGDTPLLWALKRSDDTRTVRELLRRGADPNLANEVGYASLHFICLHDYSRVELLREFFKLTDEFGTQVRLDARDYKGNTPLHIVLKEDRSHLLHLGLWSPRNDSMDTVEELLKRGADPNTYDAKGRTPLHVICRKYENRDLLKLFFDVNDEFEKTLRLDIRDKEGNTPLHLATLCGSNDMIESLLRRGADPDVANAEGLTPLHVICQSQKKHRLFKPFFKVVDSMERTVLPDVRDNEGNTPLHLLGVAARQKHVYPQFRPTIPPRDMRACAAPAAVRGVVKASTNTVKIDIFDRVLHRIKTISIVNTDKMSASLYVQTRCILYMNISRSGIGSIVMRPAAQAPRKLYRIRALVEAFTRR
uniref:Uncharacterized protein n=1 Tax=Trichogramma kaykai TaxID=54128 RepID=A0ABD2XMQ3_9HYME